MTTGAVQTFTTPVGRFVGGDLFTARTKGMDGRPLMTRDNQPRAEYVVLVAFPKSDPAVAEMIQKITAAAQEGFPTLFQNGQCTLPSFSWKIVDGDSAVPNQRGAKPCEKEGYPGNWVVTFKGSFAPKIYDAQQNPIVDTKAVKRGDFVRVAASCRANGQQTKPGVYINPSMVQLCGYGEEIRTGPDPSQAFAAPAALPPGASTTPTAPATPMPAASPAAFGAPAAPMPSPGFGAPPPAAVPAAPTPPPPAPVAPMPPPAPAAPQLKNTTHTYEQMKAAGWTDEQMKAAGYL